MSQVKHHAAGSTLAAALGAVAARDPRAIAIWYEDTALSYGELEDRIRRVAAGFRKLGIAKGDCVSLWLPNTPAWLICFFALARIGAMALATNTRFRSFELKDILLRAGVKAIVFWPAYRHIDFEDVLNQIAGELPALKHVIAYAEGEVSNGSLTHALPLISYADLQAHAPEGADEGAADAPCLLFTTSGTTRRPKLVVHVQGSIVNFIPDVAERVGYAWPGARSLQAIPLCGTLGFIQAMAALLSGTPMALLHTFDAAIAADLVRKRGVSITGLTEEMVKRVFTHETAPQPFPGLRILVGNRAGEHVALAAERGFTLLSGYGSSEVQALFSWRSEADPPQLRAVGGGVPISAKARVRARNQQTGAICAHGEDGEIEISAPSMFIGYLGDPEATAKAFTEDGYFRTGDMGHTDADGSWTFLNRIGDALKLSGFLVNPGEIEMFIREYPGVDLCYVAGVEHHGRTTVVAFYTGDSGIPEAALRAHCANGMARYKVPARFVHVAEFPMIVGMNATKLDRNALRVHATEVLGG